MPIFGKQSNILGQSSYFDILSFIKFYVKKFVMFAFIFINNNMKRFFSVLKENNINFLKDEIIAPFTSFKLGGKVDYIVFPSDFKQLQVLIKLLKDYNYKFFIVGNGSNVLFKSKPSVKVVISMQDMQSFLFEKDGKVFTSANINLFAFNKFLKDNSLGGFEFSFGIPASIGGSIKGNAGAFGDCVCNHLNSLIILNLDTCEFQHLSKKDIKFSYRKTNIDGIILEAVFEFEKSNFQEISKKQTENFEKRKNSQPYGEFSAGSIFKRGNNYIPSQLIDELGLKGFSIGGAKISEKHAGFIVKKDNTCRSEDVIELIKYIKKQVKKVYNIDLEEEIIIV